MDKFRLPTIALLLIGASQCLDGKTEADGFAGWPQTWIDAYQRFEDYTAARTKMFPIANLEISPEGYISHSVQLATSITEHLSISFYRDGTSTLTMMAGDQLFDDGRARLFPPGTYTAGLKSSGLAGYQFLYPLLWFEIFQQETASDIVEVGDKEGQKGVRMIAQPQPAEDYWPNEKLFRFFDFHIFPKKNPNDIKEKNVRIIPSVILRLTNSGTVLRECLDPELEKLLHWRIYRNGRLFERGSARGISQFKTDRGSGTYQVFVGVEGPDGFMPVSNFIEFPLFPEALGGHSVFPSVTNPQKYPDFFTNLFRQDQLDSYFFTPTDGDGKHYYCRKSISVNASGTFDTDEAKNLIRLWCSWAWELDNAMRNPDPESPDLPGVPDKPSFHPDITQEPSLE